MSYEAIVLSTFGAGVLIWLIWGAFLYFTGRFQLEPDTKPDPIELEARRLAELDINEFCEPWEALLGIVPVKPKVTELPPRTTSVTQGDVTKVLYDALTDPVTDPKAALSMVPLILRHNERDRHEVTWIPESFCLGCNKWTDKDEYHTHVYNNMGEVVYSYVFSLGVS